MRHTRNNFTSETKRLAYERSKQNGIPICECHLIPHVFEVFCGLPLSPGNTFYEHIDPDSISWRNDLENCGALTKTCWKFKTDFYDKPTIAKVRRMGDRAHGIKPAQFNPIVGTFASNIKLPLRHRARPVDRRTGKEL